MSKSDFETYVTKSTPIIIQHEGSSFNSGIVLNETNYDMWSQMLEMQIAEKEKLSFILLRSIPMWPCLPQGERPPLVLRRFFSHVLWLILRNKCSFDFFLLQMPINRQAMEGKNIHPIPHHSNPKVSFCKSH